VAFLESLFAGLALQQGDFLLGQGQGDFFVRAQQGVAALAQVEAHAFEVRRQGVDFVVGARGVAATEAQRLVKIVVGQTLSLYRHALYRAGDHAPHQKKNQAGDDGGLDAVEQEDKPQPLPGALQRPFQTGGDFEHADIHRFAAKFLLQGKALLHFRVGVGLAAGGEDLAVHQHAGGFEVRQAADAIEQHLHSRAVG